MKTNNKKIFPSNTQNYQSVPQLEHDNGSTYKMHQSTVSKPPLSIVPSEANQSYYQIIEKNKLLYLDYYSQYNDMKFMENMASLRPKPEKLTLLENFLNMFEDMISCLIVIQNTLLLMNFDAPDFAQTYGYLPNIMADILNKDIKTLEGLHLEIEFQSSLRFLETVLEALQFNSEQANKIHQLDVKAWSQKCFNHLNSYIGNLQKSQVSQTTILCPCFK
ncbi:unnamed protein product (macronuclear) [Paramecium tetraurelia]|uniref:Uncharacterized protein n=1 Tax=Paramecium tetraurelia TaxID=5888 RepID=A0CD78_PARTE|nr:uncharacterized protein GSPATT00006956001 [Paramecium tetraurelia]CAK68745.1 unnamed protein product [Paramecium tetraurelia]|eukprot:XP_001436142.1 hypothetical protein (macronuclear) [Paramecium tetraurelia strain d4-2]